MEFLFTGIEMPFSFLNSATVFIPCQTDPCNWSRVVTGLKNLGMSTVTHALKKTMSLIKILSSKVHRILPSFPCPAFTAWIRNTIKDEWWSLTNNMRRWLFSQIRVSSISCYHTFFIWPRIPLTVRRAAPSNRATSKLEVNMSFTNAVFLKIL